MAEEIKTICRECEATVDEGSGRWTIVGEREDGFEWMFLCIQCVRDWRQRGLEPEGLSDEEIERQLDREHSIT